MNAGGKNEKLGEMQRKLLLLLYAGVAIGLSHDPRAPYKILRELIAEWPGDRKNITRSIDRLRARKLVSVERNKDGSQTLILTSSGFEKAKRFHHRKELRIPRPKIWDGKWRVVIYDVPIKKNNLRFDLLTILKHLGFLEIQKSVFVHPFPCEKELAFIMNEYQAHRFMHTLLVEHISNQEVFEKHFRLRST